MLRDALQTYMVYTPITTLCCEKPAVATQPPNEEFYVALTQISCKRHSAFFFAVAKLRGNLAFASF